MKRKYLRKRIVALVFVLALIAGAAALCLASPQAARTFVFWGPEGETFEERLIAKTDNKESDLRHYIEETLLGPSSMEDTPIFAPGTKLSSFMYRNGVAYVNLSELAALPPAFFGGTAAHAEFSGSGNAFAVLKAGIRRNFPSVKDVKIFVAGETVEN
jgi:hypothetical protein